MLFKKLLPMYNETMERLRIAEKERNYKGLKSLKVFKERRSSIQVKSR